MRQPGELFLVYFAVLERLYRDAFGIKEGTVLNEPSQKAVTRRFPQAISSKLQLDYPDESYTNLAKQARRIEEVLARTQASAEQVPSVNPTQSDSRLDTLCNELSELKVLFQGQTNSDPEDVNAVSSKQSTPGFSTPRKCFACGSASHLQRDCRRVPPFCGRGRNRGHFYRGAPVEVPKDPSPVLTVEAWDMWPICSSPHLN